MHSQNFAGLNKIHLQFANVAREYASLNSNPVTVTFISMVSFSLQPSILAF